ncbi:MAG: endonuclease III domain-containing protein [Promethearchaeota archaeon]
MGDFKDITDKAIYLLERVKNHLLKSNLNSMLKEIQKKAENDKERFDSFRVLISTILSVRNRDEATVVATKRLFDEAGLNTPEKIIKAPIEYIEELIRKSGMYRTKALRIKQASQYLLEHYKGKVPSNIEDLLKIPGVGRKVANCVRVYAFKIPSIPVDTHVHRIMNRIGIVNTKKPEETEQELMKIFPKSYWLDINDTMVIFGKTICKPIGPKCSICPIELDCPKLIKETKDKQKRGKKRKQ